MGGVILMLLRVIEGRRMLQAAYRPEGMSNVKITSVALVILGIIALIYGGIDYTGQETVLEVGSFKATATGQKTIPVSSVIGALSLIGGIGLLWVERRPRLVQ